MARTDGDFVLARIDAARQALALARDATDAKKVADLARAAEVYAKRQKASEEVIEYATGIKVDALALMGEMLQAGEKNRGTAGAGRPPKIGGSRKEPPIVPPTTLANLGIGKKESAAAQALAAAKAADPKLFAAARKGKVSVSKVLFQAKQQKAKAERAKRAEAARQTPAAAGFVHGDFREVGKGLADGAVDLIFTDPPYDRKTLPLYGDLARLAAAKLADGGSLVCYLGQYLIPDVLALVTPHLRYWWTLAVVHTGRSARMNEYGVVVKWKPLLWFVKGTRGDKQTFVDDLVVSEREKDAHDWQQSVVEAGYYIDKLAPPGGLVFDPFCGGGTTAVACHRAGRRFLTCDVDADSIAIAGRRVA